MPGTTESSNHRPSSKSPSIECQRDVADELLRLSVIQYERVVVSMYAQQMTNIKTYLWTANLVLTGLVFLTFKYLGMLPNNSVSIAGVGFGVAICLTLVSIVISLSCLKSGFIEPLGSSLDKFKHLFVIHEAVLNYKLPSPSDETYIAFMYQLGDCFSTATKRGVQDLGINGTRLCVANDFLIGGVAFGALSLIFLIPYL